MYRTVVPYETCNDCTSNPMAEVDTPYQVTVSPTNIAAHRHEELKALLRDIKELLADHAAEHARFVGDHK